MSKICIFLTSCGHFICNRCLGDSNVVTDGKTTCKSCSQSCSIVKLIPNQLNPEVRYYFSDVVSVLKKVVQTAEFQKTHRDANFELRRRARVLENTRELDEKVKKVKEQREQLDAVLPKLSRLAEFVRQEASNMGIDPKTASVPSTPQQESSTAQSVDTATGSTNQSTPLFGSDHKRRAPLKRPRPSPFREYIHQELSQQDSRKTTPTDYDTAAHVPKRSVRMMPNELKHTPGIGDDSHASMNLMTRMQRSQKRRSLTTPITTPTKINFNVPYPLGVVKSTPVKSTTLRAQQMTPRLGSQQGTPTSVFSSTSSQRSVLQDPSPRFKVPSGGRLGVVRSATVRSATVGSNEIARLQQPSSQSGQSHTTVRPIVVQRSPFTHRRVSQLPSGTARQMQGRCVNGGVPQVNTCLTGSGNVFLQPSQRVDMTQLRTPQSEIVNGTNNYYQLMNRDTPM